MGHGLSSSDLASHMATPWDRPVHGTQAAPPTSDQILQLVSSIVIEGLKSVEAATELTMRYFAWGKELGGTNRCAQSPRQWHILAYFAYFNHLTFSFLIAVFTISLDSTRFCRC